MRKFDRRGLFVILGVFVAMFLFTFLVQTVKQATNAANLNNFDAGYIISDYQMRNYTSMSEADIQSFLKSKNSCNDANINRSSLSPRGYVDAGTFYGVKYNYRLTFDFGNGPVTYYYHVENGHFVCMADESFNGESAAHIIWQAAQDYRINPKVLLVLLQKEQGLITDTWPNSNAQYRSATGYGCPDTEPCNAEYYGFKNQIRKAAELFNTVLSGGWTNYPLGWNYVQYNPDADCGGSWVNIRNLATSALYRYTPYQPNSGALAAGYGTAYCGAYGNRNFYAYFEDWFGGVTTEMPIIKLSDIKQKTVVSGTYNIFSKGDTSKALDVVGMEAGGNVQTTKHNDTTSQVWQITKVDDYYVITNKYSGKVIDVNNAIFENNTNIWQHVLNKTCAQRWVFAENDDGSVTIHNACEPTYVLDLQNGNTNLQIYARSNYANTNQRWVLKTAKTK